MLKHPYIGQALTSNREDYHNNNEKVQEYFGTYSHVSKKKKSNAN